MNPFDLPGHQVKVLGRKQGHIHASELTQLARPLARAIDHHVTAHHASIGLYASHLALGLQHPRDFHAFKDLHTTLARTLGQRHGQVGGVGFAVPWQPHRAAQVVGAQQGNALGHFQRRDVVHFHTKTAGQGHLAAK